MKIIGQIDREVRMSVSGYRVQQFNPRLHQYVVSSNKTLPALPLLFNKYQMGEPS